MSRRGLRPGLLSLPDAAKETACSFLLKLVLLILLAFLIALLVVTVFGVGIAGG